MVLISHLDVSHLGALPWLVGKQSLEAPIFGTLPIQRMGRLAMTDHLQACQAVSDFQAFSSSDIAAAFDRMTIMHYQERAVLTGTHSSTRLPLTYPLSFCCLSATQSLLVGCSTMTLIPPRNQVLAGHILLWPNLARVPGSRYRAETRSCPLAGKAQAFEIMPVAAGHLVGGCVWRITTPSGETIVYASDFNNRSEHHLNPAQLQQHFNRPALMIAGATSCLRCPTKPPVLPSFAK